jgi:hypothetical protein
LSEDRRENWAFSARSFATLARSSNSRFLDSIAQNQYPRPFCAHVLPARVRKTSRFWNADTCAHKSFRIGCRLWRVKVGFWNASFWPFYVPQPASALWRARS